MNSKLSFLAFNYRSRRSRKKIINLTHLNVRAKRRATKATLFLHGNQFMYRLSYAGGGDGGSSTHFLVQMFAAISVAPTHSFIAAILYEKSDFS